MSKSLPELGALDASMVQSKEDPSRYLPKIGLVGRNVDIGGNHDVGGDGREIWPELCRNLGDAADQAAL